MIGNWMSIRMRSGRCFAIAVSACSVGASISRMIWRLSGWSSTTRMRSVMLPLNNHRKRERKRRALPRLRLDPNPSAVHLNDALGDGQSQARATLLAGDRIVGLLELLKQLGLICSGAARAGVTH